MKMHRNLTLALACLLLLFSAPSAVGQTVDETDNDNQKRAQTGMKFLSVSVDPRAAALGGAMTALELQSSTAMFYNPASMAQLEGGHLGVGQVQWISDINYNQASLAFSPLDGQYGVIGLSVVSANYGELEETVRSGNNQGYEDLGTFSPSALAIGASYARQLSTRFSIGGGVRYVRQSLGESVMGYEETGDLVRQSNSLSTPAFDFGVLYNTGFRSLNFAASVRNFSPAVKYEEESFELPLMLNIGFAMDMMDFMPAMQENHSFLLTLNAANPRDFYEQIAVGGEYKFMDLLALRAGYAYPNDTKGLNLGAGLNLSMGGLQVGADYAYTNMDVFSNVHRVGLNVGF